MAYIPCDLTTPSGTVVTVTASRNEAYWRWPWIYRVEGGRKVPVDYDDSPEANAERHDGAKRA